MLVHRTSHSRATIAVALVCLMAPPTNSDAAETNILLDLTGPGAFGSSVSGVGDLDGDGFDDLVVGLRDWTNLNPIQLSVGQVQVFLGGGPPNASPDLILQGSQEREHFGEHVAGIGDINGDTYADFAVASSSFNPNGRVFVYAGGATLTTTPLIVIDGTPDRDQAGWALTGIGDINDDGYDDFAFSNVDDTVEVHFGGATPDATPDVIITDPNGLILQTNFGFFGFLGVEDFNGDGYRDLVIPAPSGVATVYVYHGGPSFDGVADLSIPLPAGHSVLAPEELAAADLDGDGFSDLIVGDGAWPADPVGGPFLSHGIVWVYRGGPGADAVPDHTFPSQGFDEIFGTGISAPGDLDGDGFTDLVVGAAGSDVGAANGGQVYVFLGPALGKVVPDMTISGTATNQYLGNHVGSAGDLDQHGRPGFWITDDHPHTEVFVYQIEPSTDVPMVAVPPSPLRIFPNPWRGGPVTLDFGRGRTKAAWVELVDAAGRQISRQRVTTGSLGLQVPSRLPAGVYWVRHTEDGGPTSASRWVVLR